MILHSAPKKILEDSRLFDSRLKINNIKNKIHHKRIVAFNITFTNSKKSFEMYVPKLWLPSLPV